MKEDEIITEQNDYNQLLNPIEKSKLINKGPESIKEKIRMKVKILKNNETLLEEDFYNSILIKNFIFENPYSEVLMQSQDQKNNKNQNQQISLPNRELYTYYIICSFDLSEFDMNKSLIIKNNLYWEIRVFSSESLNFSKDTSKEDREKAVKDSWENSERGRSELAKTSRLRFLGISKKNRGEILGQDEEKIINTVRVKKITQSYDNFANFEKMNNADAKRKSTTINDLKIKSPSNAIQKGKTILSPEPVVNEYAKYEKLELRPIKIRADEHRSFYIRNFINYSTKERTITKGQHVAQSQSIFLKKYYLMKIIKLFFLIFIGIILNDELRKRKIEQIDKNFYNFEYVKKTENDETLKTSNNPETLKLFYKTTSSFRQQSREGNFNLLRQRDFLRGKMERIIDFERNINDILLGNNNDIYYMATIYSESLSVEGLNNNLKMNLFKFISNKKNEFYNNEINKLTAKDKNTIMKHIDDIRISNFDLDQGLIVKFETLLNEPIKKKK